MPEDTRKYIIGGGITGLIWKFYNPEFHIISPDLGGFYAKTHLVWMHDTSYTRKLLEDLSIPLKHKKSYIGYCHDLISDYQTDDLNTEIIKRKMTEWNKPIDDEFVPTSRDLSLSVVGGGNYMNTLDVDLREIVEKLGKNAGIEQGFVTKIRGESIETVEKFGGPVALRPYSELVSTMNAPLFWKAYGNTDIAFKAASITSIVVGKKPQMFDDSYEMVYYTRKYPFSRISHIGDSYAFEFTGEISKEEFAKLYPDLPVLEHFIVRNGRIWPNKDHISPQPNIIFSGRFAQWEYGVVTESVIKQAVEYKQSKI